MTRRHFLTSELFIQMGYGGGQSLEIRAAVRIVAVENIKQPISMYSIFSCFLDGFINKLLVTLQRYVTQEYPISQKLAAMGAPIHGNRPTGPR